MTMLRGWWVTGAALAVAGLLGAWAVVLQVDLRETTRALEESTAYVAQMSGELTTTRRDADQLVDVLGILRADDLVRIDLVGQPAAPGAAGRLFASRRGVTFHAERLPGPGPGRAYQLWCRGAGSDPVNVGTLVLNAFGTGTLNGRLPVGVAGVATAFVTNEPASGSSVPTTAAVLSGVGR